MVLSLALLLVITSMTAKSTGESELTKAMADHILGNVDRDKFVTVVDCNCMSHEIRGNHASPGPCLNDTLLATFVHGKDFLLELYVDVWTFFK